MKTFKTLLEGIQQFMDTEAELTEQAIHQVVIRPRIPYVLSGVMLGSWTGMGIFISSITNNIFGTIGLLFFYGFACLFLLGMFIGYMRSEA